VSEEAASQRIPVKIQMNEEGARKECGLFFFYIRVVFLMPGISPPQKKIKKFP